MVEVGIAWFGLGSQGTVKNIFLSRVSFDARFLQFLSIEKIIYLLLDSILEGY